MASKKVEKIIEIVESNIQNDLYYLMNELHITTKKDFIYLFDRYKQKEIIFKEWDKEWCKQLIDDDDEVFLEIQNRVDTFLISCGDKKLQENEKKFTEVIGWFIYITLIQMNTEDMFEIGSQQKKFLYTLSILKFVY